MKMTKPTLLLDFDAVLHTYNPEFTAHLGPPLPGARKACLLLARHFRLVCFTSRALSNSTFAATEQVERWLRANGFPQMLVTDRKMPGLILDDRAVTFAGEWTDTLVKFLVAFQPYWQIRASAHSPRSSPSQDPADDSDFGHLESQWPDSRDPSE